MVKKSLMTFVLVIIVINSFFTTNSNGIISYNSKIDVIDQRSYWPTDGWLESSPEE